MQQSILKQVCSALSNGFSTTKNVPYHQQTKFLHTLAQEKLTCSFFSMQTEINHIHARFRWRAPGYARPKKAGNDPSFTLPHIPTPIIAGKRLPRPDINRIRSIRARSAQIAAEASPRVWKQDLWESDALSHVSGVQLLFLGTGTGGPTEQRRSGALALKLPKTTWLFDCGEDTQRQVHKQPMIKNGKVDRMFITNKRSSNILGLPGMLCTMSSAREKGLDSADLPLHIYGPPGLAEYIIFCRTMMKLSDTYISMPLMVHEFVRHAVEPHLTEIPQELDKRSCLYRVLIPPDKLNPKGYYDGRILPFLSRSGTITMKQLKGPDERVTYRDLELPRPGNPKAKLGNEPLQWTIQTSKAQKCTAYEVPASVDSWAYVWNEADRVGALNVEACEELNVHGYERGEIKEGRDIVNIEGNTIHPWQVLHEDIKGRTIAFIGESSNSMVLSKKLDKCDLIVHSASYKEKNDKGQLEVKSCIEQAANLTAKSEAGHLLLYRFKPDQDIEEVIRKQLDSEPEPIKLIPSNSGETMCLNHPNAASISMVKKPAFGGYIYSTSYGRKSHPVSSQLKDFAEDFLSEIVGQRFSVSLADDLDMFALSRNRSGFSPADRSKFEKHAQRDE